MSTACTTTLELAQYELKTLGFSAEYRVETALPSFEIRIESGKIVIAAPSDVEYLYGIYDCAERFFGWDFSEHGNYIRNAAHSMPLPPDGIAVPAQLPRVKHCGLIQEYPFDDRTEMVLDWMAKNKLNYLMVWMEYYDALSDELKHFAAIRGIIIESGHHNFHYLIPLEKYADTHPEFFAKNAAVREKLLAGMPVQQRQLCTTDPGLRRELIKNLQEYRKLHPEVRYLGLNPNDGFGWCECENCSALYDRNAMGGAYCRSEKFYRADKIFHQLISAVGSELHAADPETVLNFFAYVNYTSPAPGFKLTPGLSVHLALYWRCINHDINDTSCPINSGYLQDILAWERAKAGGLFNIYEYYMGINFYLGMPMLHFDAMFREFDFYAAHHVDGVFTQFDPAHWSSYGANYLMMARAARSEDARSALERFFRARFGKYAPQAQEFYGKIRKLLTETGACLIPNVVAFLARTKLEDIEALRGDAEFLAQHCPLLPGAAFGVWVEYMCRFKRIYDAAQTRLTPEADVREFLQWIHEQSACKLFVLPKFDRFFQQWFDDLASGSDWRFFDERDWHTEYDRLEKARRSAAH